MSNRELAILQALKRYVNSLRGGCKTGVVVFDSNEAVTNRLVVEALNQVADINLLSYAEYLTQAASGDKKSATLLLLEKEQQIPEEIIADFNGMIRTSALEGHAV